MDRQHTAAELHWNGVFVTTIAPGETVPADSNYRGPAFGETWPLHPWVTPEIRAGFSREEERLVATVWEKVLPRQNPPDCLASETPDVLADVSLATEYITCCQTHGIEVRSLLCATSSLDPVLTGADLDTLLSGAQHLGYDYWDGGELSALWEIVLPQFSRFHGKLNIHGLFDERDVLEDYIQQRDLLEPIMNLERSPWMATDVWEVHLPINK